MPSVEHLVSWPQPFRKNREGCGHETIEHLPMKRHTHRYLRVTIHHEPEPDLYIAADNGKVETDLEFIGNSL